MHKFPNTGLVHDNKQTLQLNVTYSQSIDISRVVMH